MNVFLDLTNEASNTKLRSSREYSFEDGNNRVKAYKENTIVSSLYNDPINRTTKWQSIFSRCIVGWKGKSGTSGE